MIEILNIIIIVVGLRDLLLKSNVLLIYNIRGIQRRKGAQGARKVLSGALHRNTLLQTAPLRALRP
jgi:hypothetical protein